MTKNDLIRKIQINLSDDLLKNEYKKKSHNKLSGHCYVATESLFYIIGGRKSGYMPHQININGRSHWYLMNNANGFVLDPTSEQFVGKIRYEKGKQNCGFYAMCKWKPSKRSKILIDRIRKET